MKIICCKMAKRTRFSFVSLVFIIGYIYYHFNKATKQNHGIRPVVMWHGMGDTCCSPFSLVRIKKLIQQNTNNTYVKSLEIGGNIVEDFRSGFFIHPDKQVEYACQQIANTPELASGYNAIGFSQGGQFLRAVAQRCPYPPMKTLISLGGQHQGIFGVPKCGSLSNSSCEYIRRVLNYAAYEKFAQDDLVQATYWHDPLHEGKYRNKSSFLSDINNELDKSNNLFYADNLNKLEKFIMVMFSKDTIVQPKESQWFNYYETGLDQEIVSLQNSRVYKRLGLDRMDKDDKLVFLSVDGDHLQFSELWFVQNIVPILRGKY